MPEIDPNAPVTRSELDALNQKYKDFEDAHRDQVKAALRTYASSLMENPVCHAVTVGIFAAVVKLWPLVAKWFV